MEMKAVWFGGLESLHCTCRVLQADVSLRIRSVGKAAGQTTQGSALPRFTLHRVPASIKQ